MQAKIKIFLIFSNYFPYFISTQIKKKLEFMKETIEQKRINKLLSFEKTFWSKGMQYIAGVDEAGRGPLAGRVVAGAVILPAVVSLRGVRDSKKLTEKARGKAFSDIARKA